MCRNDLSDEYMVRTMLESCPSFVGISNVFRYASIDEHDPEELRRIIYL